MDLETHAGAAFGNKQLNVRYTEIAGELGGSGVFC
jgi:hypothetical protein